MRNGSVDPHQGCGVTHAPDRTSVGAANSCARTGRGSAFSPASSASPSPRLRVSSRLVRELARRGFRHVVPLLLVLAAEANGSACELTQAEIAARLALDVSNVRRQEHTLEQLGILRIVRNGRRNRRLIVIEDLDAQKARAHTPEVVHNASPVPSHAPTQTARPCAVSSARETAHEERSHIRIAGARACAEEPLSDSSARQVGTSDTTASGAARPSSSTSLATLVAREDQDALERGSGAPAAPWGPWRSNVSAIAVGQRAMRMPEWKGPSEKVDERARELHRRLAMWPNTLREVVICARDLARLRGEDKALVYLDALERHCLLKARKPGGAALNALRKRTAQPERGARLRQHVLEDVGRARHVGGLVEAILNGGLRHETA